MAGGRTPLANRETLALEIRRWYPAMTYGEAQAAADLAIAAIIAGVATTPVAHHPLVPFIADLFVVPWGVAATAYDDLMGGGAPSVPAAPTLLVVTPVYPDQMDLTWQDNADDETSYRVEQSPDGVGSWTTMDTLAADVEAASDTTGLAPGSTRYYRVFAVNAVGDSLPSAVVSGTIDYQGFVTVWRTTAPAETITVPMTTGTYNAVINWGDGTPDSVITSSTDADRIHAYAVAGDYTVTITGTFPRIFFNNTGDRLKLIKILNWGAVGWTSMASAFFGCANLDEVSATDAFNITISSTNGMTSMIRGCDSLVSIDLTGLDLGACTSLSSTFFGNTALEEVLGLETWDSALITTLANMFSGSTELVNVDLSAFNIGAVTTASNMLFGSTLPADLYTALLIAWAAQSPSLQNGVAFGAGNAQYHASAAAARAVLTGTHSWTITDDGPSGM